MEKPIYPSPYMRITQGYMMGSHASSYAIDEAGMDTGIDHIKAPFTGVIKKIYTVSNEVWLESVDKVLYPDGTVDYMTVLFCHDNDVSNLFIGKVIKQGEIFYQEGTKGNATGNHCHIECGRGKFTGNGWSQNESGYWGINNSEKPENCLWIDDSIEIIDNNGYNFKKISTEIVDNKKEEENPVEILEEIKEDKKEKPIDELNTKDIFTFIAPKTDLYGVYLKENQKVKIEE